MHTTIESGGKERRVQYGQINPEYVVPEHNRHSILDSQREGGRHVPIRIMERVDRDGVIIDDEEDYLSEFDAEDGDKILSFDDDKKSEEPVTAEESGDFISEEEVGEPAPVVEVQPEKIPEPEKVESDFKVLDLSPKARKGAINYLNGLISTEGNHSIKTSLRDAKWDLTHAETKDEARMIIDKLSKKKGALSKIRGDYEELLEILGFEDTHQDEVVAEDFPVEDDEVSPEVSLDKPEKTDRVVGLRKLIKKAEAKDDEEEVLRLENELRLAEQEGSSKKEAKPEEDNEPTKPKYTGRIAELRDRIAVAEKYRDEAEVLRLETELREEEKVELKKKNGEKVVESKVDDFVTEKKEAVVTDEVVESKAEDALEAVEARLVEARTEYVSQYFQHRNKIRERQNVIGRIFSDLGVTKPVSLEIFNKEIDLAETKYREAHQAKIKALGIHKLPTETRFREDNQPGSLIGLSNMETYEVNVKLLEEVEEERNILEKEMLEQRKPVEQRIIAKSFKKLSLIPRTAHILAVTAILGLTPNNAGSPDLNMLDGLSGKGTAVSDVELKDSAETKKTENRVEVSPKGFIKTLDELKEKIKQNYGSANNIPEKIKTNIIDIPTEYLAETFGFYNPAKKLSGVGFKGESLVVTEEGNVVYEKLDGSKDVLYDVSTGNIKKFSGIMHSEEGDFMKSEVFHRIPYESGEIKVIRDSDAFRIVLNGREIGGGPVGGKLSVKPEFKGSWFLGTDEEEAFKLAVRELDRINKKV